MKNLQVQCSSPAIILNPSLKDLILLNRNYHCNGKDYILDTFQHSRWYLDFPYKRFGRIKRLISIDDLPLYYVLDGNGERQPMFIAVPCGKCVLCTEKKANEWSTRSMCEAQTSCSPPIFFTLTYNDFCLPSNGVRKRACQRFMKRLRINLERYMKCKCNIRYYICSEYGTKTKRPHYHGILWNLPLLEPKNLTYLIQKSWSFDVSKKFFDSLPNQFDKYGGPVLKYYDDKDNRHRVLYGYTTNSVCTEGRVRYAMKYMRKDAVIPDGKNNIFFLSSRKGGIGASWIESKLDEYRKNPSLLDVTLTDVWSGEKYSGVLPRYFKNKIAPSNCLLIKKSIRDTFKLWNYYSNKFNTFVGYDYSPNAYVLKHYPSLPFHQCKVYDGESKRLLKERKLQESLQCHEDNDADWLNHYTRDLAKIIEYCEWKLLNYQYDVSLAESVPIYKKKHIEHIERFIESQPACTIADKRFEICRSRRIAQYREVM